jgi:putative NADPH-quinone reductase
LFCSNDRYCPRLKSQNVKNFLTCEYQKGRKTTLKRQEFKQFMDDIKQWQRQNEKGRPEATLFSDQAV